MNRLSILVIVTTVAVFPAGSVARASDSLLSGYGGPGNGEQALLGSQLTGGGGSGGGPRGGAPAGHTSLRAAATSAATTPSGPAAKATPTLSSKPGTHRRTGHHGAPVSSSTTHHATSSPAHPTSTAAPVPSALPRVVAYPTRASSAGALPLSLADVLVAALAAAALVLLAVGLRRIVAGDAGTPGKAQAASR